MRLVTYLDPSNPTEAAIIRAFEDDRKTQNRSRSNMLLTILGQRYQMTMPAPDAQQPQPAAAQEAQDA